jgi:hypothetical protein
MTTTTRDLLDAEMGTLPLSTVDVDAVNARQRRRARRQRAGIVTGACTALVAVVTVPALLSRPEAVPVPPGATTASAPAPSATPSLSARGREAVRLGVVLQRLLAADLPRAQIQPVVFHDDGADFSATVIKDDQGTGEIYVRVGRDLPCTGACVEPTPTPDGTLRHVMADVAWKDGRTVFVDVSNGTTGVPHPQRPEAPLTTEQAEALAQNPDLATTLP